MIFVAQSCVTVWHMLFYTSTVNESPWPSPLPSVIMDREKKCNQFPCVTQSYLSRSHISGWRQMSDKGCMMDKIMNRLVDLYPTAGLLSPETTAPGGTNTNYKSPPPEWPHTSILTSHRSDYRKSFLGQFIRICLKIEQNCRLFLDIFSSAIMNELTMTFTSRLKMDAKCANQQWNWIRGANYFGTPLASWAHGYVFWTWRIGLN